MIDVVVWAFELSVGGSGDRRIPRAGWTASGASLVSSSPVRRAQSQKEVNGVSGVDI